MTCAISCAVPVCDVCVLSAGVVPRRDGEGSASSSPAAAVADVCRVGADACVRPLVLVSFQQYTPSHCAPVLPPPSRVQLAGLVAAPLAAVRFVDGRLLQVPAVLFSVAVCVHVFLDAATELRERGVVAKAERNLWLLVERDIYASAQLVALRFVRTACFFRLCCSPVCQLTHDPCAIFCFWNSPGRTVCVLHLPASDPAAPVLFLVQCVPVCLLVC